MEQRAPNKMTASDYLAASPSWEVRHEWINGEVYAMSGGRPVHAPVITNVIGALIAALKGGPCRVASSDLRVHVPATGAWLYPDASVICGRWQTADDDALSITNPCVVVEVLSPTTSDYDRGAKVEHYLRIPSIADVLLIDPDIRHVTHLRRVEEGWLRVDRSDGALELAGPGITLEVDAIYADLEQVPRG